ncbi:MAG: MoxR family ATPase [Myxococcota bacterium]
MNGRDVGSWIKEQVALDVVGQQDALELLVAAIASRAHVILEGAPGVAKTLVANVVARRLGLEFKRVQMTPDLMPSDLLGTNVWLPAEGRFDFRRGPVFTDVLLTDELNRAPPKTQSALLQAMQERTVSMDGQEYDLGTGFWVVATQNPLDQEGTYPLPESALDRFALRVQVGFPSAAEELEVLQRHRDQGDALERAHSEERDSLDDSSLLAFREAATRVHVSRSVLEYIQAVVRATREQRELIHGAGPRAALALLDVGRGLALIRERDYVVPDDVRDLFQPCVAHRVRLAPEAMVTGVSIDEILERIMRGVPVPESRSE